ncbi:unnamed protein product, partial [Hymenolepis diminuta]
AICSLVPKKTPICSYGNDLKINNFFYFSYEEHIHPEIPLQLWIIPQLLIYRCYASSSAIFILELGETDFSNMLKIFRYFGQFRPNFPRIH